MKPGEVLFDTRAWRADICVSKCSLDTRGGWFELLLIMLDRKVGSLTGTVTDMALLARCPVSKMAKVIEELETTGTASIQRNLDETLTVACRQLMRKEEVSKKRQVSGSKGGSVTASKREGRPNYDSPPSDSPLSESEKMSLLNVGRDIVREFCREQGIIQSDADWFFFKCHESDWTTHGGTYQIRDWRATLIAWQRARYLPSQRRADKYPAAQGRVTLPTPTEKLAPVKPRQQPDLPVQSEEERERVAALGVAQLRAFREGVSIHPPAESDHDNGL